MRKRRPMITLGIAVIIGALIYVGRPVGHLPPYDASLVRLAESKLQGYCAGETFWNSGGNPEGQAPAAAKCRSVRAGTMSDKPNLQAVLPAFCEAIIDKGWPGFIEDCLEIIAVNQYWPTYDGGITNSWNRARPYPVSALPASQESEPDDSRTGGRVDVPRTHPQRENDPNNDLNSE